MKTKINSKQIEKKQKNLNVEDLIIIIGFIILLFNFVLLIISYSQFFFMFKGLGLSGYLLLFLDFLFSRNFFFLVIFALSLIYLKKIKSLFFVVSFYVIIPIIIKIKEFSNFFLNEKIFLIINFAYFLFSSIYLIYKKIRGKNEEKN